MRRSIATVTLSGSLQDKLYAAAAAKFDAVEIFENELALFDGSPEDIRELIGQLGLEISLYQPFFDFEAVPDAVFAANLDRARRKFDMMTRLGAPMMLVSSNASQTAIRDDARAAAQLRTLAEAAAGQGLRLGYEPVAWGAHIRTYRDAWRIVRAADHPALGVILDSFHTLALGLDPKGFADLPADKIFYVQLSDAPRLSPDVVMAGRHMRSLPGQGGLDLIGFTAAAIEAGYRGPLAVEVFNDELRAAPTRQTALEAMRGLLHVEDGVRRRLSEPAPVALANSGPAPRIEGVSFVEFAVDEGAASELGTWLTALGFARAGRHHSKAVELYQQGDALVALNASADSLAHAYLHLHGTSVCALGLRVADRETLLRRAEVFQYKRHETQTAPGEYAMPAVRAPDGSLFHLIDADDDPTQDFSPDAAPGEADAGVLTGFDHVARATPAAQFASWVQYYRVLLDLTPEPTWDLADPHGLVHSRAFSNAEKTVRFPLSFSSDPRTVVAKSLSTFAGAGVNQVAFATDDIFAAVDVMRRRGARLLAIPASYYAELELATDLSPDEIARLREHQVLYARDDAGAEFFHAYTETFHDRFFFEVVQRVGGYAGYGEVNAPVRMAAQGRRRRMDTQ